MKTTAEEIVKKLADWSKKYPRGRVYPMSKQTMDNELIEIENEAKEYASLKEDKPLKDKIFEVANELAVLGYGNEAVRLHQIHNSLL